MERAAFLLCLAACGRPAESDSNDVCNNSASPHPEAGRTNVPVITTVEAKFQAGAPFARLWLFDGDEEVAGASGWRGNRLVFTPNTTLRPETTYTARLQFDCGVSSWTFTTGAVAPLDDGTWLLDIGSWRWAEPEGVGDILASYSEHEVLLQLSSPGDDGARAVHIGSTEPYSDVQHTCWPTFDGVGTSPDGTHLGVRVLEPVRLPTEESGMVTAWGLRMLVYSDGSELIARITGTLDFRRIQVWDEPFCTSVAHCEPCPDGLVHCLPWELEGPGGLAIAPLELVEPGCTSPDCACDG